MITTNTNISTTANYNAYDNPNTSNTHRADRNLDILQQLQQQHMHVQELSNTHAKANANINLVSTYIYAGLPRLGLLGNTNQGVDFAQLARLNAPLGVFDTNAANDAYDNYAGANGVHVKYNNYNNVYNVGSNQNGDTYIGATGGNVNHK